MKLAFELDPEIIHHIIHSQAGSIGKAVIELLMNSVDAGAAGVTLTMTKEGFICSDDGKGFASRDEVVRYFGRFGTPHQEGDATYGRFRLGRGQIMAHAVTLWKSNSWQMEVDTRTMGYSYELTDLAEPQPGCVIRGNWYEPLSDSELMSSVQEIRDLVRYTVVDVELNGRLITKNPRAERWDHEDDFAWYRAKPEGAVSIYNQGVLIRHDASHIWGAGGLIVSKKAIALNVSRTEILRKTCPVWKGIAPQFKRMANEVAASLGDHRKTESRREKSARALLAGDPDMWRIFEGEEVITILPGKHHITLRKFLERCRAYNRRFAAVEQGHDIPKGEILAREGVAVVVHPQTLERFGCYSPFDLIECLERIELALRASYVEPYKGHARWRDQTLFVPSLVDFTVLKERIVVRTQIVAETDTLDKETRRAWVALRWCLVKYAGLCSGGQRWTTGHVSGGIKFVLLLGESNSAEAWTDGSSYIAINVNVVKKLRGDKALPTAAYIFSLVEHEVAHQGDSMDCGHDEAFYERFHETTLRLSAERQRYMHMWIAKYTSSMEQEGLKAVGAAWRERILVERAGTGRVKRGLPALSQPLEVGNETGDVEAPVSMSFIQQLNDQYIQSGLCLPPPNWLPVVEAAERQAAEDSAARHEARTRNGHAGGYGGGRMATEDEETEHCEWERQQSEQRVEITRRLGEILQIQLESVDPFAVEFFMYAGGDLADEESVKKQYSEEPWAVDYSDEPHRANEPSLESRLVPEVLALVNPGETFWTLERNAAAAGFHNVDAYLKWRQCT